MRDSEDIVQERTGALDALFNRLAKRLGATARASAVYGDPVERDGVTVIPVAKAKWGLGGGGGHKRAGFVEGVGGGGGVVVKPVGYIEIRDGRASFRPIWGTAEILGVAAGAAVFLLLAARGFRRR